jgi:hypothetical protein
MRGDSLGSSFMSDAHSPSGVDLIDEPAIFFEFTDKDKVIVKSFDVDNNHLSVIYDIKRPVIVPSPKEPEMSEIILHAKIRTNRPCRISAAITNFSVASEFMTLHRGDANGVDGTRRLVCRFPTSKLIWDCDDLSFRVVIKAFEIKQ